MGESSESLDDVVILACLGFGNVSDLSPIFRTILGDQRSHLEVTRLTAQIFGVCQGERQIQGAPDSQVERPAIVPGFQRQLQGARIAGVLTSRASESVARELIEYQGERQSAIVGGLPVIEVSHEGTLDGLAETSAYGLVERWGPIPELGQDTVERRRIFSEPELEYSVWCRQSVASTNAYRSTFRPLEARSVATSPQPRGGQTLAKPHQVWRIPDFVLLQPSELPLIGSYPFVEAVENLGFGFVVLHENGSLRYVNQFVADILDSTPWDVEGRQARCYMDEVNYTAFVEQLALRRLGQSAPYDVRLRSTCGRSTRVHVFPAPIFDHDDFLGSCGFVLPTFAHASSNPVGQVPSHIRANALEMLKPEAPISSRFLESVARAAPSLSRREREVLEKLTPGKPTEALASELGQSERSVRECLQGIYRKHGVRNRIELLGLLNVLAADQKLNS